MDKQLISEFVGSHGDILSSEEKNELVNKIIEWEKYKLPQTEEDPNKCANIQMEIEIVEYIRFARPVAIPIREEEKPSQSTMSRKYERMTGIYNERQDNEYHLPLDAFTLHPKEEDGQKEEVRILIDPVGYIQHGDLVFAFQKDKRQSTQPSIFIYNNRIDYSTYYNGRFYKILDSHSYPDYIHPTALTQSPITEAEKEEGMWKDVKSILTKYSYTQYHGEEMVRIVKPEAIEELKSKFKITRK